MRIKGYIFGLLVLAGAAFGQQQTLYTNYLLNQYLYNPAYAGVVQGTQFNLGYRNQWLGFADAPKTYMVSGYGNFKKKPNMAAGGIITTERIGLLQRTSFYATYSYRLKINKNWNINFGLGAGGVQHKVRVYDAKPYDKDDSYMSSDILNAFAFDANAGFYLYSKNFFLGFSDQHMPNAKILWANSIGRNTNHFYAYTGYNFSLDKKKEWVIQPSILARTNSPAPYQLEYHLKGIYRETVWAGFSYRERSSSSFLFGCNINKEFTFGYSYDFTLTDLNKYSSGSHELMLSYLIPFKKKKSKSELIQDADEEELNKIDNSLKTNLRNKKKKDQEAGKKTETKTETEPANNTEPATERKEGETEEKAKQEGGAKTEEPTKSKKKGNKRKKDKPDTEAGAKQENDPELNKET